MKWLATLLLVLLPYNVGAQDSIWNVEVQDSIGTVSVSANDSLRSICMERGHIWMAGGGWRTLMCCPRTTIVDLPDRTLSIYTDPNCMPTICDRCDSSYCRTICDTMVLWKQTRPDSVMEENDD